MTAREAALTSFLTQAGWAAASRWPLAGDASARRYERLRLGGASAVLMDAPGAEGVDEFLTVGAHLRSLGLSAPEVLAADAGSGFLLLEDLGDALFTAVIDADPAQEAPLCQAAAEVLAHVQAAAMLPGVPDPSAAEWAASADLAMTAYAAAAGQVGDADLLRQALARALTDHADGPRVLILRDFHAGNLIWLPGRSGLARVGLLDFQQAQGGQPGYDLVSLLQDARRDVAPQVEASVTAAFAHATGADRGRFGAATATLGALRALRILGIFARLCVMDGKDGYLVHLPRVWRQLQANLSHPALVPLRAVVEAGLPAPDAGVIGRIGGLCGRRAFR